MAGGSGAAAVARLDCPRHLSYPPGCCSARAQLPTAPPAPGFLVAARHWGPLRPSVWLGHRPLLLHIGLPAHGALQEVAAGGFAPWLCFLSFRGFCLWGPFPPLVPMLELSACLTPPGPAVGSLPTSQGINTARCSERALGAWGNSRPKQEVGGFQVQCPQRRDGF